MLTRPPPAPRTRTAGRVMRAPQLAGLVVHEYKLWGSETGHR